MVESVRSVAVWQKRNGKERVDKMKMRTEQKTAVKNSIGRLVFVALSVLLQVIWICVQAMKLNRYSTWISVATSVLTLVVVILLYGRRTNAAFKMPWIILILAFPGVGPRHVSVVWTQRSDAVGAGAVWADWSESGRATDTGQSGSDKAGADGPDGGEGSRSISGTMRNIRFIRIRMSFFIKKRRRGLKLRSRRWTRQSILFLWNTMRLRTSSRLGS